MPENHPDRWLSAIHHEPCGSWLASDEAVKHYRAMTSLPDGPTQTPITADTVLRYHHCWMRRDLDGVMALYHPCLLYTSDAADE